MQNQIVNKTKLKYYEPPDFICLLFFVKTLDTSNNNNCHNLYLTSFRLLQQKQEQLTKEYIIKIRKFMEREQEENMKK